MFNFIKKLFGLNKKAYIGFSVHYDAIPDCNQKYFIKEKVCSEKEHSSCWIESWMKEEYADERVLQLNKDVKDGKYIPKHDRYLDCELILIE